MKFSELITRWNTDEGRPYKGRLIDWDAYNGDNHDIGCMCAQGQLLHFVGGWLPERLLNTGQREADAETAKLLNISRAHAVLLRRVNDRADGAPAIVLEKPGAVIGNQWSKLLDFWWHLDGMTADHWAAAGGAAYKAGWHDRWLFVGGAARVAAGDDVAWAMAWSAGGDAAWSAAQDAARASSTPAAGDAARGASRDASGNAAYASNEIQGAAILREMSVPFFFLPALGFANPNNIPARPANYGAQP